MNVGEAKTKDTFRLTGGCGCGMEWRVFVADNKQACRREGGQRQACSGLKSLALTLLSLFAAIA